jgi:hypothetical protein
MQVGLALQHALDNLGDDRLLVFRHVGLDIFELFVGGRVDGRLGRGGLGFVLRRSAFGGGRQGDDSAMLDWCEAGGREGGD